MNILVTGGAGYIGSHFCKYATKRGHRVVVVDDLHIGKRSFTHFGALVKGDIRDTSLLVKTMRRHDIDSVVHFAAKALVGESMQIPEIYYDYNVYGTLSVLEAAVARKVTRFVFSSSAAVYGMPRVKTIAESTVPHPVNPYGRSKLMGEHMVRDIAERHGMHYAILRYFNVIGADPGKELYEYHNPETHLVPNLMRAAKKGTPFILNGKDFSTPDGTCIRDYVDVNDLARVHVEAFSYLRKNISLLSNIGQGKGYSILQLLRAVEAVTKKKIIVNEGPRRPGDPPRLVADAKFFRSWSATPLRSLEDSLKELL